MSENERLKVLQLIRDGKISPEEGLELLSVLQNTEEKTNEEDIQEIKIDFGGQESREGDIARQLGIKVERPNGKNVDINIPAGFVKFFSGIGRSNVKIDDEYIDVDEWWDKQESGYKGILLEKTTKSGKRVKIELK